MPRLLWDQVGERIYETGLDRGVLYLEDGRGVSWSGLISIDEDFGSDSSDPSYFDGIKNRDTPSFGDFSATLTAFTYPDEFLRFEGVSTISEGLYVDDQTPVPFGLSYRTRIGNDVEGTAHNYRIHILYNLLVSRETTNYETESDSFEATQFSWSISSIPSEVSGYKPTAHIIFDSRFLNPSLLGLIERILYGDDTDVARLPTIDELINLVVSWDPRIIISDSVGGLAVLSPGLGDLTPGIIAGIYYGLPTSRLIPTNVIGIFQLEDRIVAPEIPEEPPPPEEPTLPVTITDGGSPSVTGADIYDGGSPSATGVDVYDGGTPGPKAPVEPVTVTDGGTPSSTGADVYDGGSPTNNSDSIFDGGGPPPLEPNPDPQPVPDQILDGGSPSDEPLVTYDAGDLWADAVTRYFDSGELVVLRAIIDSGTLFDSAIDTYDAGTLSSTYTSTIDGGSL